MASVKLSNIASIVGDYGAIPTTLTSEAIITELISGLTIIKEADKQNWASGNLTYTVTIKNDAENPFETPKFTDTLDPLLITLVENSVQVNGETKTYDYDAETGVLSVDLETIPTEGTTTVTFQVQKK